MKMGFERTVVEASSVSFHACLANGEFGTHACSSCRSQVFGPGSGLKPLGVLGFPVASGLLFGIPVFLFQESLKV